MRSNFSSLVLLLVTLGVTRPGFATSVVSDDPVVDVPTDLSNWRTGIWDAAMSGDESSMEAFLDAIPTSADRERSAALEAFLEARDSHAAATVETRAEGRNEARAEIAAALEEANLTEALTAATEMLRALRLGPMEFGLWSRRRPEDYHDLEPEAPPIPAAPGRGKV